MSNRSAIQLINECESKDIRVTSDGEAIITFLPADVTIPPELDEEMRAVKPDILAILHREEKTRVEATRNNTERFLRVQINAQITWTARFSKESGWSYTFDQIVAEVLSPVLTEVPEVIDGYATMPSGGRPLRRSSSWIEWKAHLLTDASITEGWVDAEDEMRGTWQYDVVKVFERNKA